MRALVLVAAAVCVAVTTPLAAGETAATSDGNAGVSAGDVLSVSALSTGTSTISVSALATTVKPATVTPATETTTTTTDATTLTPASTTATSTSTTTTETSAPSTTTETTSGTTPATGINTTTATGAGVTCVFRYSMPTSSNVADELASAAAAKATSSESGSIDGSFDGSSDSSVNVGSKDSATTDTTTGSTTGAPADAGSAGDAGGVVTKTPAPSPSPSPSATTKTPVPTTKTPTATTKAPTITPSPSKTPTATASDGSGDGSVRRALAGMQTTEEPSPSPSSTSKKTPTPTPSPSPTPTTTKKNSSATTAAPSSGSSSSSSSSTTTSAPTTSSSSSSSSATSTSTTASTGSFSCDVNFYGAWAKLGLKCGDQDLNVEAAVAQTQCLIYSGVEASGLIINMKMCMSVCRFPKCADGVWDYSAEDGLSSSIYQNLNFMQLMRYAGASSALTGVVEQPFTNLTMTTDKQCGYESDKSFSSCKCNNLLIGKSSSTAQDTATVAPSLTVPVDKGLADSNHWADGQVKTNIDKAGIASAVVGTTSATVAVAAGGAMTVASGIMGTSSAGVVSAGASAGIAMAAIDICQFSIMINQMNLDARPRFLEDMGRRMAPAGGSFLPFWKTDNSTANSTATSSRRRLADVDTTGNQTQGMERYAQVIGVQVDKLFYLTVAGVGAMIAALFIVYGIIMGICYLFVDDFGAFARKWLDKTIGVLMMILILSEYVIGVTATFQFCWCIDNNRVDPSLFLSIFAVLVLAIGTILYGIVVVKNNEDELRDLGTKDHFDKRIHARYGPLYDEYSFEGRFFFAPKLLLALLCGMTTGMIWLEGLWQIVIMIAIHIAFLFYLEVKQPYPTQFVQKTSSFVIIIKISALFLSFFLISSATSFNADLPVDLREGVGFAIIGLQVLVLVCLMIRQMYIFYRTWKLKKEGSGDEDKTPIVTTTNNRDGAENFFALGENNRNNHNNMAILGEDGTPMNQQQYQHETPDQFKAREAGTNNGGYMVNGSNQPPRLRNLQPSRRTHTVVVHDEPQQQRGYRNNEVDL